MERAAALLIIFRQTMRITLFDGWKQFPANRWINQICFVFGFAVVLVSGTVNGDEPSDVEVSYNRDIRPLLSSRCFSCHGPDSESREAGLRLDRPDGDEGSHEFAIVPGDWESSEVWSRVTSDDADVVMPPPESHLKPLTESEQALIRAWIKNGAEYEQHWAFVSPWNNVETPSSFSSGPNLIDPYVLADLEKDGLAFAEIANPRTLIRRVTFDLTGLPPTREEVHRFLEAHSKSPDAAWEALVDDLLSRPQYGEHLARHWLDLVRFADTNGMHKDFYRNHIAYRDWVIRSFNENLGYDDFVRYQMAGDLYESPGKDQLIASGFHRLHLIIDRGTALPEESHVKNVLDRVTAVGTAFMGLTVQCAQCHDHKFDPISQREFFSLYAFFNNLDAAPETNPRQIVEGLQQPFARWPSEDQQQKIDSLDESIARIAKETKLISDSIENLKRQTNQTEQRDAALEAMTKWRGSLDQESKRLKSDRNAVERSVEKAMVMREREEIRETRVLVRGQYDQPGELVERGTPAFLPPLKKSGDVASRKDLAEWLVDRENPLTARVAVNRFWQLFFGVGLVKTAEDFGNQGMTPSHPALLDELTVAFVESGWDVKQLLKQIVMSRTYRQESSAKPEVFQADPENRRLARGPRYRLDAEMIRDQILATSGSLSTEMFGRSVKPPQPDGLWKAVSMIGERFRPDSGDAIYRRSIYTYWKRAMPPPQMTILNAPIRDACIARRERTNTPTQALLLLNEAEYLRAARRLAVAALEIPDDKRLAYVWETVTAQLPDESESAIMESLLNDLVKRYESEPDLAAKLCDGLDLPKDADRVQLAAWTMMCSTIYNLDLTKTKD